MAHQGMNKAILAGSVDEPPRLHRGGARPRLVLKLRTCETYRGDDGHERERRAWHDVVVWGPRAEALASRLSRGSWVSLEGHIAYSSWEGEDGRRRYRTEVHCTDLTLLDARSQGARSARDAA
jgi:single-strand DNA-binding protein